MSNDSSNRQKLATTVGSSSSGESQKTRTAPGTWPHPIVAIIVLLLLYLATQVVAAIITEVLRGFTGSPSVPSANIFGSSVAYRFVYGALAYGLLLATIIWYVRRRGLTVQHIGLRKPRVTDIGWLLGAALAYVLLYVTTATILSVLIPGLDVEQEQDVGFNGATGLANLTMIFILLVIAAPVVEEVMMRGMLFSSLRQRLTFPVATVITSLLFGALHLSGGKEGAGLLWIAAIDTFVLSVVLCYLRERTGRLWAGIGLHALKNCFAFIVLFVATR